MDSDPWKTWVPLQMACMNGRLDVVQELLALRGDRFIDVHANDECGLQQAYHCDHLPIIRELLALQGAQAPNPDVVKRLGLEGLYHDVRWDRRRAMLVRRTAGRRAARADRAEERDRVAAAL